jgi:type IV secretory pathway TraG/TraD family ATPase VirD4
VAAVSQITDLDGTAWIQSAQNLLTGAILHYYAREFSFVDTVQAILSTPQEALISEIANSSSQAARLFVSSLVGLSEKALAGIMTELSRNIITLVSDSALQNCLSRPNTITPQDLENGFDVYLNIPEHLLEQWNGFLTLIINQFLRYFEQRPTTYTTPILFLLDEFPRLGKIPSVLSGLATLRSRKITICLVLQSLAQLDMIYGNEARRVIVDNCLYKAILNATDADTQEYFSRLVGTHKVISTTINRGENSDMLGLSRGSHTGSGQQLIDERIIRPEQFLTLQQVVLLSHHGFMLIDKAPYYAVDIPTVRRGTQAKATPKAKQTQKRKRKNRTKSRAVALILAILFGLGGIHSFYLGRIGRGIFQFIFFVFWSPFFPILFESGFDAISPISYPWPSMIWYLADIVALCQGKMTDRQGQAVI